MPAHASAAGANGDTAARPALRDPASHLRIWPVALLGLALDLWSKSVAFERLSTDPPVVLIPQVLSLRRVVNPGAMLGLGQGMGLLFMAASVLALLFVVYLFAHSDRSRRSLHVGLGLVLAGAVGNLYDRTFHSADVVWGPPTGTTFRLSGGDQILLCGTLINEDANAWYIGEYPNGANARPVAKEANRYLRETPVVRDFIKIDLQIGSVELWRWVFNVADALLVVGVGLLLLNFWTEHRKAGRRAVPASATGDARVTSEHDSSR